jgi:hypothetical protein
MPGCLLLMTPVFAATAFGEQPPVPMGGAKPFTLKFDTTAPGGFMAPMNKVAVWITTTNGIFVRTVGSWAHQISYLPVWMAAAGTADYDGNMGATRPNHSTPSPVIFENWDLKNKSGVVIPDGTYQIHFEVEDAGDKTYVDTFVKGSTPVTNTLAGTPYFKNISIVYLPLVVQNTLTVSSAYGGASPGTVTVASGTLVSEYVTNSPVVNGSTQYVCIGAAVASNSFTLVSATNVTLTLTNNAVLVWQWQTNYWGVPQSWFAKYGWTNNFATAATNDPDHDGFTTWQEYVADTNPTNPASSFRILAVSNLPPWKVYFAGSSTGRVYTVFWTTNLASGVWETGVSNVFGHGGFDVLADTNAVPGARFFKLSVGLP